MSLHVWFHVLSGSRGMMSLLSVSMFLLGGLPPEGRAASREGVCF